MEITDLQQPPKPETRSPLGIDLNEIPSTSSAEFVLEPEPESDFVVRSFHDEQKTASVGIAASVPECSTCAACGREARGGGEVLVCDGCERGFHLGCAEQMRGSLPVINGEWVCVECLSGGVRSTRWPLGVRAKKKRVLDINASPPSDGDGDEVVAAEELDLRKYVPGDHSFAANSLGVPVAHSKLSYVGNGFGYQKASGIVTYKSKGGFQDKLHHKKTMERGFEKDQGYLFESLRSSNSITMRVPPQNPCDTYLQALRAYISERNGALEDGWHVEFQYSMSKNKLDPVYCAPDGKKFESAFEVSSHLGLVPNNLIEEAKLPSAVSSSMQENSQGPKRRKLSRFSNGHSSSEIKENCSGVSCDRISSDSQAMEILNRDSGNYLEFRETSTEGHDGSGSWQPSDEFPVQFEDFYILSLGKVNTSPTYHDVNLIWPVGYRSCWHDKTTGSLFMCEVLDGGDPGPVFRIKRCSCSVVPVPSGSAIIFRPKFSQFALRSCQKNSGKDNYDKYCDNEASIQTILSDPCPPLENDVLAWLGSSAHEVSDVQTSDELQVTSVPGVSEHPMPPIVNLSDEIGEISAEGRSSSLAWTLMSQKLIEVCSEICKGNGTYKFFCKHAEVEMNMQHRRVIDEKGKESFASLAKFCSSPGCSNIPHFIRGENELATVTKLMENWLDCDRFGLDVEFVQEILEHLPGVKACTHYVSLCNRSSCSKLLTVGRGILGVKMKDCMIGGEEKSSNSWFGKLNKTELPEDYVRVNCPPGKPLCSKIPPERVGDVYQVWELFWRFHNILGLSEPLSLAELEDELINPRREGSRNLEKSGKQIPGTQALESDKTGSGDAHTFSSNKQSGPAVSGEGPNCFIEIDSRTTKKEAQDKLPSASYCRCTGVALEKAHNALLKVLVSELLSKVAALVDPNFDCGESRSKRGRKKDVDCLNFAKKAKLNMLPLNELTWPEVARRYILAFLCMNGNVESAETIARESVKVFRCLQGDGGVLCGSLTGVAGMEADAMILAEATKQVYGPLNGVNDVLTMEEDELPDAGGASQQKNTNDGSIPEWAQVLEPVRKLPTNVGTRIRKCVNDALQKDPPEWAKKILVHSISKEVYKGNASGPTKKAVLSVLANVCGDGQLQKPEKRKKRKTVVSIPEIIMKKCRIVLRNAIAADDAKVFCNLLGRKITNLNDNDDEGLLGSPAMVPRPLDFRTIDLRLAAGVYGGSHEAFVEDVRELWNNVHIAYGDQPDSVELADTLSRNFESLYENELIPFVQKLAGFSKLECLSPEGKKEINDLLASTSEIPKAPWEDGVCKVCGIDRDDDSVLLCDTCDAEYHTYCLNPPLVRIPEGNWYCPSCIASKRAAQDASHCTHVIGRQRGKKYQGEVTRDYLEALARLVSVMEEREYWEFSVDERAFLFKFLCDELLNSALIRQHLEQCADTSAELQQRLRSLSAEWKTLKSKEESLAVRAAKFDASLVGDCGTKEVPFAMPRSHSRSTGQPQTPNNRSDVHYALEDIQGGSGFNGNDKHSSVSTVEESSACNSQTLNSVDSGGCLKDVHAAVDDCKVSQNTCPNADFQRADKSSRISEVQSSNPLPQGTGQLGREFHLQDDLQGYMGKSNDVLPSSDQQGPGSASPPLKELQSHNLELSSIKKEIAILQDSIMDVESQLLKLSIRRDFLGTDSRGRLYWASAKANGNPAIVVDGSVMLQEKSKKQNNTSPWVTYHSSAEIEDLVKWLNSSKQKEKELRESILQWQKIRVQDYRLGQDQGHDEQLLAGFGSASGETTECFRCYDTKAAALLEKKYGPSYDSESAEILGKHGKNTKTIVEEKLCRCECLELLFPSGCHCFSCHRTFITQSEFEGHSNGKCSSSTLRKEKFKDTGDSSKGKGRTKCDNTRTEVAVEVDKAKASKGGCSELGSRLVTFQDEASRCPFDFDEICSKFKTRDSNRELVQEIGLIGSGGVPSSVSNLSSPYLSESTLLLIHLKESGSACENVSVEEPGFAHRSSSATTKVVSDSLNGSSPSKSAAYAGSGEQKFNKPAFARLDIKKRKLSSDWHASDMGIDHRCVISQSSLKPIIGKTSHILRWLKISLLDMDAALPEEALRPSKANQERRWAWRVFVKSATTIYEMVQATIILEDMIKTEYLRNEWWHWSSLTAAARTSTLSSLALRICTLDAAIIYEKPSLNSDPANCVISGNTTGQKPAAGLDSSEKCRVTRRSSKKRKELEG